MHINEDERRALVESGPMYLHNGCRATLGGIRNEYCSVFSAYPGFWGVRWETVLEVAKNGRRFGPLDLFKTSGAWLGCLPARRSEWQTEADYQAAVARGEAR